ncbi:hypothetical protein Ancab_019433 [Ancistrocladus abbreviatus]
MAPSRRKGGSKAAAAAAAAAACRQWKVGDLVLAKVKGFPAWPATVSEPEKWGYSTDWKKVLVYFFGTNQIAFCNPADVEAFTEEKKQSLLVKRHGRSSDFVRAVREIVDCYEKLKEQNQGHDLNYDEVPAENVAVGNSDLKNASSSPIVFLRVKASDSTAKKNESSPSMEDASAAVEVGTLTQGGESEEPMDNMTPNATLLHTCSARKKSRSIQSQCFDTRRSRSSLRLHSQRSKNGTMPSNDGSQNAGNAAKNGSGNVLLRRNKRKKKSPDESIRIVEESPVCDYNGNVEDNGSEIDLVDSDALSNNGSSATESNCKLEQSEVAARCGEDLELSERLDLQTKTIIVRKKRKPGRRRVTIDIVECARRPDQEVNLGIVEDGTTQHVQICENHGKKCSKDDSDEHLPLLKRARVRMAEEQHDILIKEEKKSSVAALTNVGAHKDFSENNGITGNDSLACLLPSDSCAQVSDESQLFKAGKIQLSSFSLDGEASLPPSKRLHRALEAMSANTAEEDQVCAKASPSLGTRATECLANSAKGHSDSITEQEAGIHLEVYNQFFNWNKASQDDSSGPFTSSKPSTFDATVKSSEDAKVSHFLEDDCTKGKFEEAAFFLDAKVISGSLDVARTAEAAHEVQSSQVLVNDADGGDVNCRSENIVLNELSPEGITTENRKFDHGMAENDSKPGIVAEFGVSSNTVLGDEEAAKVKFLASTAFIPCSSEDKLCETPENFVSLTAEVKHCGAAKSVKPEIDESSQVNGLCHHLKEVVHFTAAMNVNGASSPALLKVPAGPDLDSFAGERLCNQNISSDPSSNGEDNVLKWASPPASILATSDDNVLQHDNCHTPDLDLHLEKHASDFDGCRKLDSGISYGAKPMGKWHNHAEIKAGILSLKKTLATLTRTKESIARATRIAIDYAKFGDAAEVVDILAHYLERESRLYKRVDLFFLVDSIAQCSRGLRGGIGDIYTSAIQDALPRLLAAAAPSGYAARENRRQCRKVLKLWLERRILSESVIRQCIRDLDSLSCSSSTGAYSRRMSRTERALDDPVREMEGMLDEYGSNSSIDFPGFCMPSMLKVQDDGSDSDGESFEAVTPEHESAVSEKSEATALTVTEKHRHILEAVDGELEMEDVAPSCEAEMGQANSDSGTSAAPSLHPSEQFPSSYAAPLPFDVPSLAPPLPASPPPLPPPPPPLPPPLIPHNMQETMPSRPPGQGIKPQMLITDSTGSCSFSPYPGVPSPTQPANNLQQADVNLHGNGYHLQPPLPNPSNQFSYFQADRQPHQQRETSASVPSLCDQPHIMGKMEGGHIFSNHDRDKPPRHKSNQRWKFYRPMFYGPPYLEKDNAYGRTSYYSPCERRRNPNDGWGFPPRPMHDRNHASGRPFSEGAVPVAVRAPSYWKPR